MPKFPIVDLSEQQEPDITDDQRRRIYLARHAAAILRGPAGVFGSSASVEPHAVVCLANYLEAGLNDVLDDGDDWMPTPPPMPGPLDDEPDNLDDPGDDHVNDGFIIIKARDLRTGDRSPDWTVVERLALPAEEATPLGVEPSMDPVQALIRWQHEDQPLRPVRYTWEPNDDVALLERGPLPNTSTEPDPDIAPREPGDGFEN